MDDIGMQLTRRGLFGMFAAAVAAPALARIAPAPAVKPPVDVHITGSQELMLSLDDFGRRYIEPAALKIANECDRLLMVNFDIAHLQPTGPTLFNPELSYKQFMLKAARHVGKTGFSH